MQTERVFIVSAYRSAIGSFAGALATTAPADLGAAVAKAVIEKSGTHTPPQELIVGNVLAAGHGMNIARQVALKAGLPNSSTAFAVNKVCGSGLKAIILGAQSLMLGDASCVVAGGVESMSQAAYVSLTARAGARMGHTELKDLMISDGLTDAFHSCHMGITAENLAERFSITRQMQDEFAAESQARAARAISNGLFNAEIVPVPIFAKGKQTGEFAIDEYPRPTTTVATLSNLKPAFKKDGTVTAGNASGINDGAAFVMMVNESELKRSNLKPMAEVIGYATSGVAPDVMGLGPVEAVKNLLSKIGLALSQFDRVEANEAFAVQSLAVAKELGLDAKRTNPTGGAIALGHPIGASGARVLVTLLHGLIRDNQKRGLATLCIGGGQGVALAIERA